jgi:hypothetical protein
MSVVGCEVLDVVHPGDITTYQEKQLKSRKHTTRRQTDEEKWRDIYQILFPNEDIPSPCMFFCQVLSRLMGSRPLILVQTLSLQRILLRRPPSLTSA